MISSTTKQQRIHTKTFIMTAICVLVASASISISGAIAQNSTGITTTNVISPLFMKLILKDGSQLYIDPTHTEIPVKTKYGKFKLSIGALRAVKFSSTSDDKTPDEVIVRFQTGLIKRLKLNTRKSYITALDTNNDKVKIVLNDIMGILSSSYLDSNSNLVNDNQPRYTLSMKDGSIQDVTIPVAIMKIKTKAGTLYLPTPMIHALEPEADSKHHYEVTTVYGEKITGKIPYEKLRIEAETEKGYKDIRLKEISKLEMKAGLIPVPNNWLVWYIKPGLAVGACFSDPSVEFLANSGDQIQSKNIFSITKTVNGTFCVTRDGKLIRCQIPSGKTSITLLSTGTSLSIPWSEVCSVKSQQSISAKDLVCLMVDTPKKGHEKEEKKEDTIKIRTSIGSIKIPRKNIAVVQVDKEASKACLTTIYHDCFITSIPSRSWFATLLKQDKFEFPESDTFKLKLNDYASPTPTTNSFICRLTSGDILNGTVPTQELSIERLNKRSKPTKININNLQLLSRDDKNDFYFQLSQGEVSAKPVQRHIELNLSALETEPLNIGFRKIETLVINSNDLPPTPIFTPGMPPTLRNEVKIDGGSFMQGSDDGMDDEMPIHKVTLNAFYIDATEVTRSQFSQFIRDSKYKTNAEQSESKQTWQTPGFVQSHSDPAVCITWTDAAHYCNWRSKKTGLTPCYTFNKDNTVETDRTANGYRLPTESEWEFAARNRGENNLYACDIDSNGNLLSNAKGTSETDKWVWTNPVKYFKPNKIGIYGMSGNVWEWCEDWYFSQAYVLSREGRNPCITRDSAPSLNRRVMRGGSFRNSSEMLRCTSRGNGIPFAYAPHVGFRCVRNAQ